MTADAQAFDITLRDGRVVHVRTIRPTDEAELVQAFDRMGPDARYLRFMRVVQQPDLVRLRAVLGSFPDGGLGFVATTAAPDGIDIVGSNVAIFDADRRGCEFAITVDARFGGSGLATQLMRTLIDATRSRGLQTMEGFVLAMNQPMLRLARRLGFMIAADPDDPTVRICRLPLAGP
jgi:RimJ/RimL family protein N-acetyltransferase